MAGGSDPFPRAQHLLSLLYLLSSYTLLHPSFATPFSPDDVYTPICGSLIAGHPAGGYKLWSDSATWNGGPIPGIDDNKGANVTVPCGVGILLDVSSVELTLLDIQGSLKFLDSPSLPSVNLTAAFILVQGRLIIGEASKQFSQKATIKLIPNPNDRAHYLYTANAPADTQHPRDLGHKVLAVVGGRVELFGLPSTTPMLTWTKLGKHANKGDNSIVVRGDVSLWPVGSQVLVTPTDFFSEQAEVATVTSISSAGNSLWSIVLDQSLSWNHFGDPQGVPDGFGGYVDETAEVALLSRNILILGEDEPAPYDLEGGHFIVFQTQQKQHIQGIQLMFMGQQGALGKYPLHFHVCGDQSQIQSVVQDNVILHSKQRCIVVHATFNLVVQNNVAYNTSGHCFMVEDGSEVGNTFINNLGARTRAVQKLISPDMSDSNPATFWISNPNNNYIGNVAAGSEKSGFWFQFPRDKPTGLSSLWTKVNQTRPINEKAGVYQDNSAHSNSYAGFQSYKFGYYPKTRESGYTQSLWVSLHSFTFWKNTVLGAELHNMERVAFVNCTFADNPRGAHLQEAQGLNVTRSRFIGQSPNYGTPYSCSDPILRWRTCAPVYTCSYPLTPGDPGRSIPNSLFLSGYNQSSWGIVFTDVRMLESGTLSSFISSSTFSGFHDACHPAAGVAVGTFKSDYWNAGNGISGLKFAQGTNPLYLYPWLFIENNGVWSNGGELALNSVLRDFDGSLVGSPNGGYIVANNPNILPPSSVSTCKSLADGNAWACPDVCYRTMTITFDEPAYTHYPKFANIKYIGDGPRKLGDYAYLTITRVEDNHTYSVEGNLREYQAGNNFNGPHLRIFSLVLLGGFTHSIQLLPGTQDPGFLPSGVTVKFQDGLGCGKGLTLRFLGATTGSPFTWSIAPSAVGSPIQWKGCPARNPQAKYKAVCSGVLPALDLTLGPSFPSAVDLSLVAKAGNAVPCTAIKACGTLKGSLPAPGSDGAEQGMGDGPLPTRPMAAIYCKDGVC